MPTSASTRPFKLGDGSYYYPVIRRLSLTTLTTGDTETIVFDTRSYRVARGTFHAKAKAADSTFTFYVNTGPTTVANNNVFTSSGAATIDHATTDPVSYTWPCVGNYLRLRVSNHDGVAASGMSTGVFFDLELV